MTPMKPADSGEATKDHKMRLWLLWPLPFFFLLPLFCLLLRWVVGRGRQVVRIPDAGGRVISSRVIHRSLLIVNPSWLNGNAASPAPWISFPSRRFHLHILDPSPPSSLFHPRWSPHRRDPIPGTATGSGGAMERERIPLGVSLMSKLLPPSLTSPPPQLIIDISTHPYPNYNHQIKTTARIS